ncbi:MAG TPA: phosphate signaling complex protein PhoU [Gammaproteobacteria bacterium]|nr:phosphate signaling complex protein PhoU [Gammaproteobacteria bacterium]
MDIEGIGQHISRQYNEELEDIRTQVMEMGGLVEMQLNNAINALVESDRTKAESVITSDLKVNSYEVDIDEECVQILARRQPAASDLRLIMTVIKTITDLERIGDEAERISKMTLKLHKTDIVDSSISAIGHMGHHVRHMVHDALDAFARMDAEAALKVWHEDRNVDKEYEGIMRQLMTYMMEDPRSIPNILDLLWSVRALERIGDRATNICEYVMYLVKGKDVRHTTIEKMEQHVLGSR